MPETPSPMSSLKTGTSVCLVRYDQGLMVVADRRVSMMGRGEVPAWTGEVCKIDVGLEDDRRRPRVCIAGAGHMDPLIKACDTVWGEYLRHYERKTGISLLSLRDGKQIEKYLTKYFDYLRETGRWDFKTGMSACASLQSPTIICTDHVVWGCLNLNHVVIQSMDTLAPLKVVFQTQQKGTNYLVSGSGGDYLRAVLFAADQEKPLHRRSLSQVQGILKTAYTAAVGHDLYSHYGVQEDGRGVRRVVDVCYVSREDKVFVKKVLEL